MSNWNNHWILFMALALSQPSQAAMKIGEGGIGEVLIYPYYTVNNGLNTLYSVINTTADTKAIKVRFLEGENSAEVLEFNVYLDAYDVWWGALVPTTSTINGHNGELSVLHVDNDNSCAPFLTGQQEFLPFIIDADAPNNDLQRGREGHIEVIEMATFDGVTAAWADHGEVGVPAFCDAISEDWVDDSYDAEDEDRPTGGLFGSSAIIDVANGHAVNLPAIALSDFWTNGVGSHTAPGSLLTSLSSGQNTSEIRVGDEINQASWFRGIDAVSALLMSDQISNQYSIDSTNDKASEWVINFPTKTYYTNGSQASPPFSNLWNGTAACETLDYAIWDNEQISDSGANGETLSLCYSTNVIEYLLPGEVAADTSKILGSPRAQTVFSVDDADAGTAGWMALDLTGKNRAIQPSSGDGWQGLPVIAYQIEKFVNPNAAEGLFATFMSANKHVNTRTMVAQNQQTDEPGADR